uniref:Fucosyltransferase n=1 Tax=Proboscia inermis TaxID=420281 RepID=A0A7S0CK10_9STRA|mmetsp:Transcript_51564/g.51965  ORF Transcript_51564/g.51965 Transcript_51564/m.51965 type:complete len:380 (+) Transcript_51564:224-1363(+)
MVSRIKVLLLLPLTVIALLCCTGVLYLLTNVNVKITNELKLQINKNAFVLPVTTAPPTMPKNINNNVVVKVMRHGGRTGHQLKDIASAVALTKIMGSSWMLATPSREFTEEIISIQDIATNKSICCGNDWPIIHFDETRWSGFESYAAFEEYVNQKVPVLARNLCVQVSNSWRIQMHNLFSWEKNGFVSNGTYEATRKHIQNAVTAKDHNLYWNDTDDPGVTRVVVHQRRGDRSRQSKTMGKFHILMEKITEWHKGKLAFHIITEPKNSEDVFENGCKFPQRPGVSCIVSTRTLAQDFGAMFSSDILVVTSSSLSIWAGILGEQTTVYWMPNLNYKNTGNLKSQSNGKLKSQFFSVCEHPPEFKCLNIVGNKTVECGCS